jgi:hypothetical protein
VVELQAKKLDGSLEVFRGLVVRSGAWEIYNKGVTGTVGGMQALDGGSGVLVNTAI